jgi:hypothetical protein
VRTCRSLGARAQAKTLAEQHQREVTNNRWLDRCAPSFHLHPFHLLNTFSEAADRTNLKIKIVATTTTTTTTQVQCKPRQEAAFPFQNEETF